MARRAIGAILADTPTVDVDVVSLVVTELIGRLSHPPADGNLALDVHVDVNAARVRVHVTGPPRGEEDPTPQPTLAAGWSLLLMERSVDRWGIDDGPATRIWFEIDLDRPAERSGARRPGSVAG